MATNTRQTSNHTQGKSYFEQQREVLIQDIAVNMEQVLQNINKLNRSLESVIAVGNEFGQVEGLWSQFENVMAKDGLQQQHQDEGQQQQQQQQQQGAKREE